MINQIVKVSPARLQHRCLRDKIGVVTGMLGSREHPYYTVTVNGSRHTLYKDEIRPVER